MPDIVRIWDGNTSELKGYFESRAEIDFTGGIWDMDGRYTIGIKEENGFLVGIIINSAYDDWLPNMVKFKTLKHNSVIRTAWIMRDHSVIIYDEPILHGNNTLIIPTLDRRLGSIRLQRLSPAFPMDFSRDATYFVEMVEAVHPIFILEGMLPDNYDELRAEFLNETSKPIYHTEFQLAAARYRVALRDGHMNTLDIILNLEKGIDLSLIYDAGRLFFAENNDVEVIEIGDVPVSDIIHQIERHHYFENVSMRSLDIPRFVRFELILRLAGAEINENNRVIITLNHSNQISEVEFELIGGISTAIRLERRDYIIRHEIKNDIFYISLSRFVDGEHITEVAEEIARAVENGIWRFIVDVRGNPGGNANVGLRLAEAMGVGVPTPGVIQRISDLALQEQFNNMSLRQLRRRFRLMSFFMPNRMPFGDISVKTDRIVLQPSTKTQNPNNVFVSVLTDKVTFSAATGIGYGIQDGNLGNVIGEPSRNAPNSFANMIYFRLPESRTRARISSTYYMRPNTDADPNTLVPDIMVSADRALEVAIEYLSTLERPEQKP